jgi:hypothetical protein
MLIEEGLITRAQRDEALRNQMVFGGKLGTNLVELGAIDLDVLARALAKQHGVPAALQKHFEQIPAEAVALLPAHLATKHRAVPLGFTSRNPRTLAVAFEEPSRAAIDELHSVTGTAIYATVAPELRILIHLEKIYGVPRPLHLRLQGLGEPRGEAAPSPQPGNRPPLAEPFRIGEQQPVLLTNEITRTPVIPIQSPSVASADLSAPDHPLGSGASAAMPAAAETFWTRADATDVGDAVQEASPVNAEARAPITADQALDKITAAGSRDDIGGAILDYLRSTCGFGVLFIVQQDVAIAWKGFAPGRDSGALRSLSIPLLEPSLLRPAYETQHIFRGTPPLKGAAWDMVLWRQLRSPPPEEVVVAPVVLKNRVVTLIYGHAADGGALPDAAVVDLTMLCPYAAAGYIQLIQTAKKWKQ